MGMELFILAVIVLLSSAYIVFPLITGAEECFAGRETSRYDIETALQNVADSLRELELDYKVKKLSEEDYRSLKAGYEAEMDELEAGLGGSISSPAESADDDLEKEIAERRRKKR